MVLQRYDKSIGCKMIGGEGAGFFHERINFIMVKNIRGGVIYKLKKQIDRKCTVGRDLTSLPLVTLSVKFRVGHQRVLFLIG